MTVLEHSQSHIQHFYCSYHCKFLLSKSNSIFRTSLFVNSVNCDPANQDRLIGSNYVPLGRRATVFHCYTPTNAKASFLSNRYFSFLNISFNEPDVERNCHQEMPLQIFQPTHLFFIFLSRKLQIF